MTSAFRQYRNMAILILSLFVITCKKRDLTPDNEIRVKDEVIDTISGCMYEVVRISDSSVYTPVHNPFNDQQFVFSMNDGLYTYDFSTRDAEFISAIRPIGKPVWLSENVLLLSNFSLMKVDIGKKSDEYFSKSLDPNISLEYPSCSPSGEWVAYSRIGHYSSFDYSQDSSLTKKTTLVLSHTSGGTVRSMCLPINSEMCFVGEVCWLDEQRAVLVYGDSQDQLHFTIANFESESLTPFHTRANNAGYVDHVVDAGRKVLYFSLNQDGVYSLDINSGSETRIRSSSEEVNYRNLSISNDGSVLLCSKETKKRSTDCMLDIKTDIVELSNNGTDEKIIEIN